MSPALVLLLLMNVYRATPLVETPTMDLRAQARVHYICTHSFSHDKWVDSFRGLPYRNGGENLARYFPSVYAEFNAWMASPEHQANIMNPLYKVTGSAHECEVTVVLFAG